LERLSGLRSRIPWLDEPAGPSNVDRTWSQARSSRASCPACCWVLRDRRRVPPAPLLHGPWKLHSFANETGITARFDAESEWVITVKIW